MASTQTGDSPLSEPMMTKIPYAITRPQWVKRKKILLSPIIARFNEPWYHIQHCDEHDIAYYAVLGVYKKFFGDN